MAELGSNTSLAFLYVLKNAKEGMTPAELYAMYNAALEEIKQAYKDERNR